MSTLDAGLLEEAFKRALSGGKCSSDVRQRSPFLASSITDLRKSATRSEFLGSADTPKDPNDFSNTYVQFKSISSQRTGGTAQDDINLQRPVIMQKGSFQPKQVYLYEQNMNGRNEIRMEDQEMIDNLFINQQALSSGNNGACSRGKKTSDPESNGEDDQVSEETKSQFTDSADALSRLKQHTFIRQATQALKKEAQEHLDAKMAQQFMINKRQMQAGQEHEVGGSQISDINFSQDLQGQDSQDNNQFQKEYAANQDLISTELVVLDVDNSDVTYANQNQREMLLASKRSNTAQTYQGNESALSSKLPMKTRKRYNKDVRDPLGPSTQENSLEKQQEPRVQVDFRNDLLNIIAEKQDLAAERQCASNQWRQQNQGEQDLPSNSNDDSEAHSSVANPLLSSIQLTETASDNSRVKSKNGNAQAKLARSQASKKRNDPNRFRASVQTVTANGGGRGQRGSSKAPPSRQTTSDGANSQTAFGAERKSCVSSTLLPKTPTGEKKAWKASQGRVTLQTRDKPQISNIPKVQRVQDANRVAHKSPRSDSRQRSLGPKKYQFQQRSVSRSVNNHQGTKSERDGKKLSSSQQPIQLTPEQIRQDMVSAFSKVKLDLYSDILRIKKPQHSAFLAGQLLCKVVNSFRGGSQKTNNDSLFQDWRAIQDFVHRKPNVIKFHQEITQLIQHMILSQDYLDQLKQGQLKNHLSKLIKIQEQYFGLTSQDQVLRQFQTNKNFQSIANICFTAVRYVLLEAGKSELINLCSHENVENEDNTSHKALTSNKRSRNRSTYLGSSQRTGTAQRDASNTRGTIAKQIKRPGLEKNQQHDSSLVRDRSQRRMPVVQKEDPASKDQAVSRRAPLKSSVSSKSPLTSCNARNTTKTPRDVAKNQANKSPITQNYASRRSMNSVTRGIKESNEEHNARIQSSKSGVNGLVPCLSSQCLKSDGKAPIYNPNLKSQTQLSKASPTKYVGTQGVQGLLAGCPQPLQQIEEKQNSKKLYEIMLRKQKQMTQDRYERLTTNSVSKGARGKRLQVTPGGDGAATSEAPQHQEGKADSKDDVPTPERAPTATQMMKTPIKTPTKAHLEEDSKQVSNSLLRGAGFNEADGLGLQLPQQQGYSPSDHSQMRQRKSRKDRSKAKPTSNNTTPTRILLVTAVVNLDKTADFTAQIEPKETDEMKTESQYKDTVDQSDKISMGKQKYAKTLLPLQMQAPLQSTPCDQLEQANPAPQKMPGCSQVPNKRQGDEHQDSEILEQMRKVAPAPAPQPAQPLALAHSFEENHQSVTSQAHLKAEEVNHISTDTTLCHKKDDIVAQNDSCQEHRETLVSRDAESSAQIYVDEDSQSVNRKDETESPEKESPEKEVQEFDPFVEAQRIAAIIKAECLANLRPEEQSSEEDSEDSDEDSKVHTSELTDSGKNSVINDQDSEEQFEDRPKQFNEEISTNIEQPANKVPEDNTELRVSPDKISNKYEDEMQDVEVKEEQPKKEELVEDPPPETPQICYSEKQSLQSCDQTIKRDHKSNNVVSLSQQLAHLQSNGQIHNPTDQTPGMTSSPGLSMGRSDRDPLAQSSFEQHLHQTEQRLSRVSRQPDSIYEEYSKPDALLDHGSNPTDRDQLYTDRLKYQTSRSLAQQSHRLQEDKNQEYGEESESEFANSPAKIICREDPQKAELSEQNAGEEQTARYPYNKRDTGLIHRQGSSENSDVCMQEIVSPLRQMRLSRGGNDTLSLISPENQRIEMERTTWQINPIQVRCQQGSDDNENIKDINASANRKSQQSENSSIVYSSPGGGSPCESPVVGARQSGCSPVISPGKLKCHLTQTRTAIYQHLLATQKEIEDNSPSRSSTVDSGLIEALKQRRLMQKATGREEPLRRSLEKAAEHIDQMYSRQYPINLECMAKSIQPNLPNK